MDITVRKIAPGESLQVSGRLVFKAPAGSWGVFMDGKIMIDISPVDAAQMFSIWPTRRAANARKAIVEKHQEFLVKSR